MNVYMTKGTTDYLSKLQANASESIWLMQNEDGALAYYEGDNNPFQEPLTYEVVDHVNELKQEGYVVLNNIPVTDEGRPIFEDRFKNRAGAIEDTPGFQAIRILRPTGGDQTYVVFTQWKDELSFLDWKESQAFQKAHRNNGPQSKEKPSYIAGPSYLTKYHMSSTQ
ncbi:hypothetical protein N781_14940 [Pontibacillus halophilus JSM 076056 = DSM 19796]|uniref:ABM domain-containing protein n=1 Tax=Pontibacillus halophilus JSM 076056 = DSM 19796 TaxID=1385510 RepID=A0A0A5GN86_9BACI|nr:antibiotic biosynthesis monooxygenase [Pontibacillus halophilus]KGX92620.1 hypothetical protein N781_14940 [Pontibacillus halophilus JSM 076056 = DSM 19796]